LAERILFRLRDIVGDAAALGVHVGAAEFLLGDLQAQGRLHHRRTAGEQLRGAADYDVAVRHAGVDRRQPGHRAEHRGHHRYRLQQGHVDRAPDVPVRQVGPPDVGEAADAAAARVEQPDIRHASL